MSIRQLFGLEPDKLSANVLRISGGSCFDYYGSYEFKFPQGGDIDLTKIGLWGIDKPVKTGDLCVYVIRNAAGDSGMIASQEKFAGDVACPAGFFVYRKLPFGVVYNPAWDGIPNFHLAGWPRPDVRLTDSEYSGKWTAVANGNAAEWADADVSGWVPDNARIALLMLESRYVSGTAGSSYVRSHGGQSTGLLVGSVSPGSPFQFTCVPLRVDSLRRFQYKTTGTGCRLNAYVLGYSMTEPA